MFFSTRTPLILSAVLLPLVFVGAAAAQTTQTTPCVDCLSLNLPSSVMAATTGHENVSTLSTPPNGYLEVAISSPASTGSLPIGTYAGWCVSSQDYDTVAQATAFTPTSTFNKSAVWNEVNYILNNKQGYVLDVQEAIWIVMGAHTDQTATTTAQTLATAAQSLAGQNFVPAPGQIVGVLLTPPTAESSSWQSIIVEVTNPCGAIGDYVWNDKDDNGIQETTEVGINGVTVQLTYSGGPMLSTVTGPAPASYTYLAAMGLGPNGYYQFGGLCAGNYTVTINNGQAALSGFLPTKTLAAESTPANDSNINPASVSLATVPSSDETIDFGYWAPAPVTLACAAATGQVGVPYSSSLVATGGTGGYTFSIISGSLPAGLTLNPATGAITGIPTAFGTSSFTAQVMDNSGLAAGTTTSSCTIVIAPPPITLACAANTGQVGVPYSSSLVATGGTGVYTFSISSGSLPAGLTLNPATGAITGTPTAFGTSTFTAMVVDSSKTAAGTTTSNCTIVIAPNPIIVTCPLINIGQLGVAYSSSVGVSGGVAPYSYLIYSGALPTGLTLNTSTGAITGTPTVAGSFNFSIKVTDSLGSSAISACACSPVASTWNFASPTGNQGNSQSYTVNGIAITAYGFTNSGRPTALIGRNDGSDLYGLGIDATSSNEIDASNFVQLDLTNVVAKNGQNLMITVTNVLSGESYNVYGSNTLGSIGTLLLSNQTLDGTPLAIPNFASYKYIGVRAVVGNVLLGAVSFTLGNCNITVTVPLNIECGTCGTGGKATVGTPYAATLRATGGTAPYTYAITTGALPAGLTLNPTTGVVSGTPTTAGTYTFTSTVTDSKGNTDFVVCTIVVIAVPPDLECGTCAAGKATVGTPYSAMLSVVGGTAPFTFSIIGGSLPPGLTLNTSTGAITGTPTTAGYYTITAKVVDAAGKWDTSVCPIVVVNSPVNLDCGPCSAGKAYVGTPYNATMPVTGAKSPYTFSIVSGKLPAGLTLNTSTGVISGTPTTAGTYTFTAKVVDANGNSDTDNCTIVVVGAPPVNLDCGACGSGSANGKVGSPYSAALSVNGGKSPFTYSISSGSLPPGLSLNSSTGVIAGTPTTAGSYTFTAMVKDANGSTDTATCTIVITGSAINLNCGSCGSGKATVGVAYSSTLTVTGGIAPFTFSIVSGSLPPGLTLGSSTGKISGTPTTAGAYTFTSKVVDSKGNTDTQSCTIVVTGTPINLNCATSCGTSSYASVGASYSAALTVTGGVSPFTFSLISGSLPPGLTLNASTGAISGTPTTAGTYTFTSMVKDSKGNTDTQACTIVVSPSALNLVCGTCGSGKTTVGASYSATMSVTGGTGPYTYSLVSGSLPPGLTLNTSSGVVSGKPTTAGTYVFTTKVVDAKGKTDTATCTIVVAGVPVNLNCGPCSAGKATAGTQYTATMSATGGTGPYTYSIVSGSLPQGLTLNASTGVISGTPTTVGIYNFVAKVVDAAGNSDTDNCTIVVIAPAVDLDCGPCSAGKTSVGASYSATMVVSGGKGPYTFSIISGSLPAGITLNTSTGVLSGKPATAGTYTFTTKVVDSNGSSDTDTCTIVVERSGW